MSVSRVALCAAVLLSLTGCARSRMELAVNDPFVAPHSAPAPAKPDDSHLHAAPGDGPLPQDPIANAPPMPVALLEKIRNGTASAFLLPQQTRVAYEPIDLDPAPAALGPYLLDVGDKVRVFVYGQPNLSHIYPVDGAGFIAVPLIGAVKARGLTTYRLAKQIAAQLAVSYVKDPQVSVEIAQARPFYILGEVRAAGQYPFEPGLSVEAAVAIAGGYSPRASQREVRISRRIGGAVGELQVPPSELVRPGDTIYVPERWF